MDYDGDLYRAISTVVNFPSQEERLENNVANFDDFVVIPLRGCFIDVACRLCASLSTSRRDSIGRSTTSVLERHFCSPERAARTLVGILPRLADFTHSHTFHVHTGVYLRGRASRRRSHVRPL